MVEVCAVLCVVALCLETIDVCIWRMYYFYVCCSDCVGGLWECLLCSGRC